MARYSIMVFEHGGTHEVELMQVDANPEAMVAALRKKTLTFGRTALKGPRKTKIPQYSFIRIVDREQEK